MEFSSVAKWLLLLLLSLFLVVSCSKKKKTDTFFDGPESDNYLQVGRKKCVRVLSRSDVANLGSMAGEAWQHQDNAIAVRLLAGDSLNQVNSLPHAIVVGFYQLKSTNIFAKQIATRSGLRGLLLEEGLDDTIVQADTKTIQPRSSTRFDISRAEEARYFAIVVGYNSLVTTRVVRVVEIPLVRTTRSRLNPINWITKKPNAFPAELNILIRLGANEIEDIVVNVRNEC